MQHITAPRSPCAQKLPSARSSEDRKSLYGAFLTRLDPILALPLLACWQRGLADPGTPALHWPSLPALSAQLAQRAAVLLAQVDSPLCSAALLQQPRLSGFTLAEVAAYDGYESHDCLLVAAHYTQYLALLG